MSSVHEKRREDSAKMKLKTTTLLLFTILSLFVLTHFVRADSGGDSVYTMDVNGTNYTVRIFTQNGTYTPTTPHNVELFIVAGGGGGGVGAIDNNAGAGGGAGGGVYYNATVSVSGATTVIVGIGGMNRTYTSTLGIGAYSSFGPYNTTGGGRGGSFFSGQGAGQPGGNGGSGGGGASCNGNVNGSCVAPVGGTANGTQGNGGGNGFLVAAASGNTPSGGGGGGCSAAGSAGTNGAGGAGGQGCAWNLTGTVTYYGSGGGGTGWSGQGAANTTPGGGAGNGTGIGVNGVNGTGSGGGAGDSEGGGMGGSGIVIIRYPTSEEGGVEQILTISTNDIFTNTNLTGFCLNATGTNTSFNGCNATGTKLSFNTTGTYNLSVYNITVGNTSQVYLNGTRYNYAFTTTAAITISTSQSQLNVSAYRLFVNTSISTFNITNLNQANQTTTNTLLIPANNGTNNLKIDVPGNYSINATCTGTSIQRVSCNITGVYDNKFTFGVNQNGAGVAAFNITATNTTIGANLNQTTTNGSIVLSLLQGYPYYFNVTGNFATQNQTILVNNQTQLYNFSVLTYNTFELNFYNESTNTRLTNNTIYVQLISPTFAANYTTNATSNSSIIISLLVPENYTIRYYMDAAVPRDYYVELTPYSYNNLSLYIVDESISSLYLPVVVDERVSPVGDALVQLMRYYVSSNSYVVVEMTKTDTNGQGVLRVVPNIIYYKLILSKDGTIATTTPTKFTANTNTYTLSSQTNVLTSIAQMPSVSKSFTYNNATQAFTLTWTDTQNLVESGCMKVTKLPRRNTSITLYDQCQSGSSGSLTYTITDTNDTQYFGSSYLTTNTEFSNYPLEDLQVDYTYVAVRFGVVGLLILLLVLITVGFVSQEGGGDGLVIGTIVVMIFLGILGVIFFNWMAYVGIFIIGIILIYKTRR